MQKFNYKARDEKGNLISEKGFYAENVSAAREQLLQKGLWIIELKEESKAADLLNFELDSVFAKFAGVSLKDKVIFCRQFSSLVNSGVAMLRAMTILSEQCENPKLKKILRDIKEKLEQGSSLSDAFAQYPSVFDKLFISMIKAGETGGILDDVLMRIAAFMEDKARLNAQIKSALTYPTVVTILAMVIFVVMLTFILPKFSQIFSKLGGELPAYTQFLINISELLRSYWSLVLIAGVICFVWAFKKIYSLEKGKYIIDALTLKVPLFGPLLQKVAVARFTRTLGTLIRSGVPILISLEIVQESSGNAVLSKNVGEVYEEIKQGGALYSKLEESPLFPPMVTSMISVGEETGELDNMLNKVSDFYDSEIERTVEALTSLIEPLMMVVLGGMIGAVIVGMYLPMFAIFDQIN